METTVSHLRIVKNRSLTVVGLSGNQDNQQNLFDKIGEKHPMIKHISMPYACQVVWSTDKQKGEYETFIGCVVSEAESIPKGLELHQIVPKNYAVFEFSGTASDYMDFIKSAYYNWLPDSGYAFNDDDFSYIHFHKTSPEDIDSTLTEHQRIYAWELWLPIK